MTPPSPDLLGNSDQMWQALARYVSGEGSTEERDVVKAWLDRQPARAEFVAALAEASRHVAGAAPGTIDVEMAVRRVRARLSESGVRRLEARLLGQTVTPPRRTLLARVAAVGVLLVAGALLWHALR